jgi:hypothetical protein
VERAGEPVLARAPAVDHPHAAVAAHVLEGAHVHVPDTDHDDGLVEDLVLDEVVRLRDLLQPARHLPHPGPQQLGFQGVEVRVVVALLAHPVRDFHRVGQHATPLSLSECVVIARL